MRVKIGRGGAKRRNRRARRAIGHVVGSCQCSACGLKRAKVATTPHA